MIESTSRPPARVGIVGAGHWAATHYLPYFAARQDVTVVGVVGSNREILSAITRIYGVPACKTTEDLLALGLDGLVVSSPHHLHAEHAIAGLRVGANVLVEKPMALTVSDATRMCEVAGAQGRQLSVALGWNYFPAAIWGMEVVTSGRLGSIRQIYGHMASPLTELLSGRFRDGASLGGQAVVPEAATWANAAYGGGYIYGQLSHLLGLALEIHQSLPTVVSATVERIADGVDVGAAIAVEFSDGSIGCFGGSGRLPRGAKQQFSLTFHGTEASLVLDLPQARAELIGPDGHVERFLIETQDTSYNCDGPAALIAGNALDAPVQVRASAVAGLRAVAVMEAAVAAAASNERVAVTSAAS